MLSQKLLVDVSVDMFAGKNRYRRRKSAAHSARIASFRPLALALGPMQIFMKGLSCIKLSAMSWRPVI
jgi:hypothetical protein